MPEGLSAAEVGKEIGEHRKRGGSEARSERRISIVEAVILSVVAVLAAWSGFSAAKWGTKSSVNLTDATITRGKANRSAAAAQQIRTFDSVSFNAAFSAFADHDRRLLRVATRRMRPGYRPVFRAWLAQHPLTNPHAAPGPAYLPQYEIPAEERSRELDHEADRLFKEGEHAGDNSDDYVSITVLLATVLFLVGIGSHFTLRRVRYGLVGVATVMLLVSVVSLATLPGLP